MAEVPHLVQMQKEFANQNFTVVGLMKGPPEKASRFALEHNINYPILASNRDFAAYKILFLPVTYLVAPNGEIVADNLDDAADILRQRQNP